MDEGAHKQHDVPKILTTKELVLYHSMKQVSVIYLLKWVTLKHVDPKAPEKNQSPQ